MLLIFEWRFFFICVLKQILLTKLQSFEFPDLISVLRTFKNLGMKWTDFSAPLQTAILASFDQARLNLDTKLCFSLIFALVDLNVSWSELPQSFTTQVELVRKDIHKLTSSSEKHRAKVFINKWVLFINYHQTATSFYCIDDC